MDRTEHWDRIYERRSPRRGQLVRAHADDLDPTCSRSGGRRGTEPPRRWRRGLDARRRSPGAGTSSHRGLGYLRACTQASRERLGSRADQVEWIVGDVTAIDDVGMFDIWHDRAVFHFLTDAFDQERYVSLCERTVTPGGIAIVATFAPDGPEMCSGLPVQRYDASGLAERCGPRFELLDSERHVHLTPRGSSRGSCTRPSGACPRIEQGCPRKGGVG